MSQGGGGQRIAAHRRRRGWGGGGWRVSGLDKLHPLSGGGHNISFPMTLGASPRFGCIKRPPVQPPKHPWAMQRGVSDSWTSASGRSDAQYNSHSSVPFVRYHFLLGKSCVDAALTRLLSGKQKCPLHCSGNADIATQARRCPSPNAVLGRTRRLRGVHNTCTDLQQASVHSPCAEPRLGTQSAHQPTSARR